MFKAHHPKQYYYAAGIFLVLVLILISCTKETKPPTNTIEQGNVVVGVQSTVFNSQITTQDTGTGTTLGEVGQVDVTQGNPDTWHTVELLAEYTNPVVVLQPISYNEVDPTTIRVRNISSTSFEFRLQEWEYLKDNLHGDSDHGLHATERVGYMVVEKGAHILENGIKLEAGTVETDTSFKAVRFEHSYEEVPVVLSQVVTNNDPIAVISRQRDVKAKGNGDNGGFEIRLQEEENGDNIHTAEEISYIAIEQSQGQTNNNNYIAGLTPQEVTHEWYTIDLGNLSATQINSQEVDGLVRIYDEPILLANMQTYYGKNPATLRYRNLTPTSTEIFIQDEQSADVEQRHPKEEVVGYLAFEVGFIFADPIETESKLEIVSQHILGNTAELGQVKVSQADPNDWHNITTLQSYDNPVVIMQPLSFNGGQPATIRLKQITSQGFEFQIQEWDYLDGNHPAETVSYLVVEKGQHNLDGLTVEANTIQTDSVFKKVTFDPAITTPPVILSQVQTINELAAVTTRQKLTYNNDNLLTGFKVQVQQEELTKDEHGTETVGYVMLTQGEGSIANSNYTNYYIANSPDEVDHNWYGLTFPASLITPPAIEPAPTAISGIPYFFANMQSKDGGNTSTLRYRQLTNSGVEVFVEDEQSKDRERWHRTETVGFAAFMGFGDVPSTGNIHAEVTSGFNDLLFTPSAVVNYNLATSDPVWNTNNTFEVTVNLSNTSSVEQTGTRIILNGFAPSNVVVVNPDGYTAEGYPFIEYDTIPVAGTASQTWTFYAPDGEVFDFNVNIINVNSDFEITSVSPASFSNERTTIMTIQGEGFRAETAFFIQSTQLAVQNWTQTQATLRVPKGFSPATYGLMAVNPDGNRAVLYPAFTVTEGAAPPQLDPKDHPFSYVEGYVYDYATDQPLQNAVVSIPGLSVATDAAGYFLMRGVPPGSHAFKIERIGYEPVYSFADVLGEQQTVTLRYVALEPKDPNETMIGPAGGTHHANNGAFLVVPEGALSETVPIHFTHTRAAETISQLPEDGYYLAFATLGPSGLVFDKPATLFLPLQDGIVFPEGTPIRISYFDEREKRWVQDITSGIITDIDGRLYLEYEINHFTSIGGQPPSPPPPAPQPPEVRGCVIFEDGSPAPGITTNFGTTNVLGQFRRTITASASPTPRTLVATALGINGATVVSGTFNNSNEVFQFPQCIVIPFTPVTPDLITITSNNSTPDCGDGGYYSNSLSLSSGDLQTLNTTSSSPSIIVRENNFGISTRIDNFRQLNIDPSTLRFTIGNEGFTPQTSIAYGSLNDLLVDLFLDAPLPISASLDLKLTGETKSGETFEQVTTVGVVDRLQIPFIIPFVIADEVADPTLTYPYTWEVDLTSYNEGDTAFYAAFLESDLQDGLITLPVPIIARDNLGNVILHNSPEGQELILTMDSELGSATSAPMIDGRVSIPVDINVSNGIIPDLSFRSIAVTSTGVNNLNTSSQLRTLNTSQDVDCVDDPNPPNEPFDIDKKYGRTFTPKPEYSDPNEDPNLPRKPNLSKLLDALKGDFENLFSYHVPGSTFQYPDQSVSHNYLDSTFTDDAPNKEFPDKLIKITTIAKFRPLLSNATAEYFVKVDDVDDDPAGGVGFTFVPIIVAGKATHFLDGGIRFSFTDLGNGKVQFCITAQGQLRDDSLFGIANSALFDKGGPGHALEDAVWLNLLKNIVGSEGYAASYDPSNDVIIDKGNNRY